MKFDILTLFPDTIAALSHSIIARAEKSGALEIRAWNIRDYTQDKHGRCDDYSFGGGEGLVMAAQPIRDCLEAADPEHKAHRIYMSPRGKILTQEKARALSAFPHIIILCGHYEGVDQRVIDNYIDEEISIGDYVLTGGELPAMILCDCVARFVPGVLGNPDSLTSESFEGGLLEYPQYTRPPVYGGLPVPEILLSGDHAKIDSWRQQKREEVTRKVRPDLWRKYRKGSKK